MSQTATKWSAVACYLLSCLMAITTCLSVANTDAISSPGIEVAIIERAVVNLDRMVKP